MLYLINWSLEGQAIIEAKDEDEAVDIFHNSNHNDIAESSDTTLEMTADPPKRIESELDLGESEFVLDGKENYHINKNKLVEKLK